MKFVAEVIGIVILLYVLGVVVVTLAQSPL